MVEQLQRLLDFQNGPFDEREKVTLACANQLTIDAHRSTNERLPRRFPRRAGVA